MQIFKKISYICIFIHSKNSFYVLNFLNLIPQVIKWCSFSIFSPSAIHLLSEFPSRNLKISRILIRKSIENCNNNTLRKGKQTVASCTCPTLMLISAPPVGHLNREQQTWQFLQSSVVLYEKPSLETAENSRLFRKSLLLIAK